MSKRKRGAASGILAENVTKSAEQFEIPVFLKTEQIEVESNIKPEIIAPCIDSKSSNITISSDNILTFTCGGCGASGIHHLGLEYRLVRTATLVEVGTQTGDESNVTKVTLEALEDDDSPFESGGEEEVISSEDDMMLGLTDETLSDSSEEEEEVTESSSQKPTSPKLSALQSQPLQSIENQSTTANPDNRRKSARNKRVKRGPESLLCLSPVSSSEGEVDNSLKKSTSKIKRTSSGKNSTGENVRNAGYQCKIQSCSVIKPSEKDLFEHVRTDHADRKYRCDVCPIAFEMIGNLNQHNLIHCGDKRFQCDECGKKFSRKVYLMKHQSEKKLVICGQRSCGMRFPKNLLFDHIRTAHPKEKFQCGVCPMSFKMIHLQLTSHERKHNGNKPYECEVCGKKFSHLSTYKRHTNVHTGERPFKCDVCGKSFSLLHNMKNHMMSHTELSIRLPVLQINDAYTDEENFQNFMSENFQNFMSAKFIFVLLVSRIFTQVDNNNNNNISFCIPPRQNRASKLNLD
eukprot:sb/3463892/